MKDEANWCEKTECTVRARTYCIHAFRSVVCIQHGIRKLLRAAKPLNVFDEAKRHRALPDGRKEIPAAYRLGGPPGG